mmetsp:Transcript_96143/g.276198  ORF Transcript_96143/g.276198 Transcript_96143/m.276198 type:complete len:227 (-) Transcript_96143:556-1236(-)
MKREQPNVFSELGPFVAILDKSRPIPKVCGKHRADALFHQVLLSHGQHRLNERFAAGDTGSDLRGEVVLEDGSTARRHEISTMLHAMRNVFNVGDFSSHTDRYVTRSARQPCKVLYEQAHVALVHHFLSRFFVHIPGRDINEINWLLGDQTTSDLNHVKKLHAKTLRRDTHPHDEVRACYSANALNNLTKEPHSVLQRCPRSGGYASHGRPGAIIVIALVVEGRQE